MELSRLLQGYGYDGAPAVFFRRSRSPWLVVMKLEDWIRLYRKGGCDDELLGN